MRVTALLLLLAPPALAAPPAKALVLEASVGHETSDVHRYLPDVAAALGQPLAGRALADAVDARFGPAPARIDAAALAELAARARQAERNLFFNGTRVRESIDELETARARLGDAQWTLAHEHDARLLYQHVLLKLARAYQVTHGPEAARLAEARMQELVRNLPDLPVDPWQNERELYQLYERVRAVRPTLGRLQLTLPPQARLYVEGRAVTAPVTLPAGEHRLYVTGAGGDGRVHRVSIGARELQLDVDLDFETALRSEAFVGFVYESAAARARSEARLVGVMARALDVERVYVLAADAADGRPAVSVWAYAVDARGARLTAESTARGDAPADVARAASRVAAALDGGVPLGGVTWMAARPASAGGSTSARSGGRLREDSGASSSDRARERALVIAGWTALGVGLPLATAGGAGWRHIDLHTAAPLVGCGVGLAVAGTVWAVATPPDRRSRARSAAIAGALWAAAAAVVAVVATR